MADLMREIFDYDLSADMLRQVETLHVNSKVPFDVLRDKFEAVKFNEFQGSGDAPFSEILKTVRNQINLE